MCGLNKKYTFQLVNIMNFLTFKMQSTFKHVNIMHFWMNKQLLKHAICCLFVKCLKLVIIAN